jgi:hypothetical protein
VLEAFGRSIDVHLLAFALRSRMIPASKRIIMVRGAGYVFARAQDGA